MRQRHLRWGRSEVEGCTRWEEVQARCGEEEGEQPGTRPVRGWGDGAMHFPNSVEQRNIL